MRSRALGAVLFLLACGPKPPPERPVTLDGGCPLETRVGGFLVEIQDLFSLVDGEVADGVVPAAIPELVVDQGGCQLLKRVNPFCNPPCQSGTTCDTEGTCIPFPANQDIGPVTVRGLEKAELVMTPVAPGNNYFDTDVPNPVFVPDAEIFLDAEDESYGAITMEGRGVAPLESSDAEWVVDRDQDLPVSWIAGATDGAEISLRLNVDQHGNTPITLVCSFGDTGQAQIPAALVNALLDSGVSGFPNGKLIRQTVDSQEIDPGCIDFVISAPVEVNVRVAGHIPCNGPNDCPDPLVCDIPNNTCVAP